MGFPYGADEDAAYIIAWLELNNFNGIVLLANKLNELNQKFEGKIKLNNFNENINFENKSILMKGSGLMPTPVSRYQGLVLSKKKEDVMLIDTQTGDLYELMGVSDETIWRKYKWHGQDFIKWKGLEKNK